MPLPNLLRQNQTPLGALAPSAAPAPLAGGPPAGGAANCGSLRLNRRTQLQTQWCWAAVSSSVARFYNFSSGWTQCLIAESALSISGCCLTPVASGCNVPYYLDRALGVTGNYTTYSGPPTANDIAGEVSSGRALC